MKIDADMMWLFGGVLALLAVASVVGFILSRRVRNEKARETVRNLNMRTRAWWMMCAVFASSI